MYTYIYDFFHPLVVEMRSARQYDIQEKLMCLEYELHQLPPGLIPELQVIYNNISASNGTLLLNLKFYNSRYNENLNFSFSRDVSGNGTLNVQVSIDKWCHQEYRPSDRLVHPDGAIRRQAWRRFLLAHLNNPNVPDECLADMTKEEEEFEYRVTSIAAIN